MFIFFRKKEPISIGNNVTERVIERQLKSQDNIINHYEVKNISLKKELEPFNNKIDSLEQLIVLLKNGKDSLSIINTQDTVISYLKKESTIKNKIIENQDTIISTYKYKVDTYKDLILVKDDLLSKKDKEIKKQKRKKILFGIGSFFTGVGAGTIIGMSIKK